MCPNYLYSWLFLDYFAIKLTLLQLLISVYLTRKAQGVIDGLEGFWKTVLLSYDVDQRL